MGSLRDSFCLLQGSGESQSSRLFREGSTSPEAGAIKAAGGDFRKVNY